MSEPRHYLLVDDNRELAENLAEILRDEGHQTTVVSTGAAALELAARTRFDALLTDMRMPVMTGAQLVHGIRRVDPALPALVITAYTGESDLVDARREGLLAVLPKPVPVLELLQLLKAARRGALVVVIEDDLALADNLSEVLRSHGFTTVSGASLLEAGRLGALAPLVALVDLKLPDGPEGEVVGLLRARFPGLPVWAVTGHPELSASAAPDRIFPKPFDSARLLAALDELHQLQQQRSPP